MKTRLASLFLVLVLASSVFAGVPLHFGQDECSMHGMANCCKTALLNTEHPEVATARLCCALECPQSGATSQFSHARVAPLVLANVTHSPAVRPFATASFLVGRNIHLHGPPGSPPTYLLNLAFLI
jgi:hypothetical protein